ncbi:MBL fold metallo-hydrolase [Streptomyces sp. AVP053U2]|uniref:MBL fold metallo-hydrolase n=1 Tax=Streptomyces sp. AVP053U2 TaxID=1737066 RepID=UPI00086873F1|nr:putative quorum-quenching lactonase YtnP [Streptomyces sp. AVP053U2]
MLVPHHWEPDTGLTRAATQSWVLRSEGRTILIDTGAGNGKYRPLQPIWSYPNTGHLANLAAVGVRPEDVDIVVNTHLHDDHVGRDTRLEGRDRVPAFPRATYLMPQRDVEYRRPENLPDTVFGRGNQNVYEDSVDPVVEAGPVETWDESCPRARPDPDPCPAASTDGVGVRRPTHRDSESFERESETFSAESIDDPSSIPRSFPSGKPAPDRYFEPHRPWAIRAARQIHAQPHHRSAHQSTCATRFVPVGSAPVHPGSSRSGRGPRRRVAVPRLSRDGVPPVPVSKIAPSHARGVR